MNTKILAVAPYSGMKTLMEKVAGDKPQVELDVRVGDFDCGLELAKKCVSERNYDVIVSRAGTADLISEEVDLPVIKISISVYDILRAIKIAENNTGSFAIVGFPEITYSAKMLCELLKYHIEIRTVRNKQEIFSVLKRLKSKGCHLVVCDMVTCTVAQSLMMNAILVTSGRESVSQAFDQAIKLHRIFAKLSDRLRIAESALHSSTHDILVFDSEGTGCLAAKEVDEEAEKFIQREIKNLKDGSTSSYVEKVNHNILSTVFTEKRQVADKEYFFSYMVKKELPLHLSKYGVQYKNKSEIEAGFFNSFYNVTEGYRSLYENLSGYSANMHPLAITGEEGTGKMRVAEAIYTDGLLANAPFIVIDFSLVNDKAWNYIFQSYASPLNESNVTLYFKGIEQLSRERRSYLISYMVDTRMSSRNKLIFSGISEKGNTGEVLLQIINEISCACICLPALRERKKEIPMLANICLNTLNIRYAKEIFGIDEDGMEILIEYEWPQNYKQFKRVMEQLVSTVGENYIRRADVVRVIQEEVRLNSKGGENQQETVDIHRTLDEINREIVKKILVENNYNQSQAAKKLGISRTTLWRMIKEE